VQRKRRPKAVPKDIFGNAPKPVPTKKEVPNVATKVKQIATPTPKPPPSVEVVESLSTESVIESDIKDESPENVEEEVVESQILGVTRRKSIGLRPQEKTVVEEIADDGPSNKAQELIDESRLRAEVEEKERGESQKIVAKVPIQAPKPKPPAPRPRRRKSSFQPAARAKRLDRSRHMEYKYEMRGLLTELDIPEEHRSNILGTIWARGERLTAADAKEFISEKREQGVLTEDQDSTLKKVVDRYTVRR